EGRSLSHAGLSGSADRGLESGEHPVRREAAHRVDRDEVEPRGPARERAPQEEAADQHGGHEGELAELDADVEGEERERKIVLGETDLAESAREAESVEQAEDEGHEPGKAAQQVRRRVGATGELDREDEDAPRDEDLDLRLRELREAERGERQGDAVPDGEGGDRLDEEPDA